MVRREAASHMLALVSSSVAHVSEQLNRDQYDAHFVFAIVAEQHSRAFLAIERDRGLFLCAEPSVKQVNRFHSIIFQRRMLFEERSQGAAQRVAHVNRLAGCVENDFVRFGI